MPTSLRRLAGVGVLAAALVAGGAVAAPAAPVAPVAPAAVTTAVPDGSYVPLTPVRLVDTRSGLGTPRARLDGGRTITPTLAGRGGLPAAASVGAVVVNLTVVGATAPTYVTLFPSDGARPGTSSTNVAGPAPVATSATVRLSAAGALAVYNAAGSLDVIVDVVGYYAQSTPTTPYGGLTTLTPYRKLDSRTAAPGECSGPFTNDAGCWLSFDYLDDQGNTAPINDQVTAYVVNVTATGATGDGYVVAWDGNDVTSTPGVSTLNFRAGTTVANLAVVPRGTNDQPSSRFHGKPWIYLRTRLPGGGGVQVVVDVVGLMTRRGAPGADDARFVPLTAPTRVVDSRVTALGGPTPFGPAETRPQSGAPVVDARTSALAGSLTLVRPTASTYLTVFPSPGVRPQASAVNAAAGAVVTNGALVALAYPPRAPSATTSFALYNASGSTHVVLDVTGTFEVAATTAARAVAGGAAPAHADGATDGGSALGAPASR
ncbi:hypothetical protein [Lapillicoccus jejuensis]|uniref:hypothetical protein n=1 Tax=Lapillicoccus jejuensis TaxID=402171 RepID=UPI00114E3EF4|nr:hypothetical protein [Lapillicoccus jejuensis]